MKVSPVALKLCGSVLVGILLLSQSDAGDKLGCIAAWLIYCCMSEENCCCNAGDKSAMLSGLVIDVTVSVADMELLVEVEVGGGTVAMLAESAVVAGTVGCSGS